MSPDPFFAFIIVCLSTAAGIFGLYILPVAGISLLIVASISGLRLLLSYVRSPVGQHKDAGEGALTVAMVSARMESDPRATPATGTPTQPPLFTVGVISGYSLPDASHRGDTGIPGPAEWIPPIASEQTREIPRIRAQVPRLLAKIT